MLISLTPPDEAPRPNSKTLPAAEFYWRAADNAELAREPILAHPDSHAIGSRTDPTGIPGVIVMGILAEYPEEDLYDVSSLGAVWAAGTNYTFSKTEGNPHLLTRRSVALDAFRLLVIDQGALSMLDPAQRDALLTHVRGGATLLVVATDESIASTWIGSLLPLDIAGAREASSLTTREFGKVKLRSVAPYQITLARAGAQVVLSDEQTVFAAYREVGFGRIAMTGLPVNAIDPTDPSAGAIWANLIGSSRAAFHDPATIDPKPEGGADPAQSGMASMLPQMVGATAPPWRTAAIIAIFYTGAVAIVLLLIGAARRPIAIVGCVAGAILLAGGVLGLGAASSSDQPLTLARLAIEDVQGQAIRREETITFFGQPRDADIDFGVTDNALPRAIVATGTQPPRVSMYPFRVSGVSASTGNYASVWNIRSQRTDEKSALDARLRFGADGAKLNIRSDRDTPLSAARLLFAGSVLSVSRIETGEQSVAVAPRNPVGDWSEGGQLIADEQSKLRTDILLRAESRQDPVIGRMRRSLEPRLIAFSDMNDSSVSVDGSMAVRSQTLVRTPVTIEPSEVGSPVRVDPGFTQLRRDMAISLPYRAEAESWADASQGGPWLVAIAAPREIGKIDPKQLTLNLDLRATGFNFTIQRGQVANGIVQENPTAETILKWDNTDGAKDVTIDLTPADVDANGWVWLRITADTAVVGESLIGSISGMGNQGALNNWRMLRFDATLSGTVASAPHPIIETWKEAVARNAAPARPTPKAPTPKK
jgi:hypothetical protein